MNDREKLYQHCLFQGMLKALGTHDLVLTTLWNPWGPTGQAIEAFGKNLPPQSSEIATKAHSYADACIEENSPVMSSPFFPFARTRPGCDLDCAFQAETGSAGPVSPSRQAPSHGLKKTPAKLFTGMEKALLVKGDLSGIQDFIFKVKSKGAA